LAVFAPFYGRKLFHDTPPLLSNTTGHLAFDR
jgi:hypothetical protein